MQIKVTSLILLALGLVLPIAAFADIHDGPVEGMHQEIQSEMEDEEKTMLPPVEVLWRGTLQHNTTLQLALQKLGEKTGQVKDKAQFTRQVFQTLVQAGAMGSSVAMGNPAPLLGSSVINKITTPDTTTQRLTAVTGADLVVLAKEVEHAQNELMVNYMQYRQGLEELSTVQQSLANMENDVQTIAIDHPEAAATLRSLILEQTLQKDQITATIAQFHNILVLTCGEPALQEADKLEADQLKSKTTASSSEKP